MEWAETPYYPVAAGGVAAGGEPVYVMHVGSLHPGTLWAWEVSIREQLRGPQRHGLTLLFREGLMFSATVPRSTSVDEMKERALAFIAARDALVEMGRTR